MSEVAKHRHLAAPFCSGNGVDLGSSGDPVVPWAVQVELPALEYHAYNLQREATHVQWRGTATDLPFKDETLDFVHASHLLEDFAASEWPAVLAEWSRVLKYGGFLLIAVPDHERFRTAVEAGQGDNLSHVHEPTLGEVGRALEPLGYVTLFEKFVSDAPTEYSFLYVGIKR